MKNSNLSIFACPECHAKLWITNINLTCEKCHANYPIFGSEVPIFMPTEGIFQNEFVSVACGLKWSPPENSVADPNDSNGNKSSLKTEYFDTLNPIFSYILWHLIIIWLKAISRQWPPIKKIPRVEAFFKQSVEKTANHNLQCIYHYVLEKYLFSNNIPVEPSLEISGNWGAFSNDIFRERCRISCCSEYFGDWLLNDEGRLHARRHEVHRQHCVAEGSKLPFPDNHFQTVLAMKVIHHLPDISVVLKEVRRILRPGGCFYATGFTNNPHSQMIDFRVMKLFGMLTPGYKQWRLTRKNPRTHLAYVNDGSYPTGQNRFSLDKWQSIAKENGFQIAGYHPYCYGNIWDIMMDANAQKLYCPDRLSDTVRSLIYRMIYHEIASPPQYDDANYVLLVFKKQ